MASDYHKDEELLWGTAKTGGRYALDGLWRLTKWGLGKFGITISWKYILIGLAVLLFFALILAGYASIVNFSQGISEPYEIWDNESFNGIDADVNNAAYVRQLIVDGYVDTTQGAMGMIEYQDTYDILTAVMERETAQTEEITICYEYEEWERVLTGEGEYTNEIGQWNNTGNRGESQKTLQRNDLEAEGGDSAYSNSYMLRWQPILVLCIMRAQHEGGNWGYDSWETVDESYNDYFLTDEMINECIAVFDYEFAYYFDFFGQTTNETIKDFYKFEDFYSYRVVDGRLTDTQGVTALHHMPVSAPAYVKSSFITINYNLEDSKLETRTLQYTPHKFLTELEEAAGGTFNQQEFLMMLEALPGTEDLVEEYRMIFELAETYSEDDVVPKVTEDLLYTIYVNTFYFNEDMWDLGDGYFQIYVPTYSRIVIDKDGNEVLVVDEANTWVSFPLVADDRSFIIKDGDYVLNEEYNERTGEYSGELSMCLDSHTHYTQINNNGCKKALLKAQEELNVYLPAVLSIICQEGAAKPDNKSGINGNYLNITANGTEKENGWFFQFKDNPHMFVSYKKMAVSQGLATWTDVDGDNEIDAGEVVGTAELNAEYGSVEGYCLYYSIKSFILGNYVKPGIQDTNVPRQDTLFEFSWWYGSNSDSETITHGSVIDNARLTHCYCPWWDDRAFDSSDHHRGGWSANCAEELLRLEEIIGGMRM